LSGAKLLFAASAPKASQRLAGALAFGGDSPPSLKNFESGQNCAII